MNQTRYGRAVYAVGGNEEAARAAGIAVERVKYQAFLVNGVLVGIAGVIFMSRVNAGLPNAGVGYELQAITAPIIGGTSFSGGVGTVFGTLAGALIVGVLGNIMNLIGIGSYIQQIVMGSFIVIAVAYDVFSKRGKAKTTILKSNAKGETLEPLTAGTAPPDSRGGTPTRAHDDRSHHDHHFPHHHIHQERPMKTLTRRIIALGAAAAAAISLAGCAFTTGNPTGGGNGEREQKDEFRVAYIARTQTDSFAAWLANEMKAEAENYEDITLEVLDGQGDDEILNRAIENAIANRFDAIIVQANNADAQLPYIQQAVDAGTVTITTNPRVEGVNGANSVDASPYDQGAVVAEYALEQIPEGAKVVVLTGPAGNFHSDQRRLAWQETFFDQRPDVEIVAEDIANWQKNEALDLMEDWKVANPQIDAIISMNDNMAAGALEAVKGEGVLASGVDGTPEAALLIEDGTMTATSLQSAIDLAELNLKAVHELLTGAEDEVNVDIDNPLITVDNAQEYIDLFTEAGLYR